MAKLNQVRDSLIELCREEGIEIRKGEYQILLDECVAYIAMKYGFPRRYADMLIFYTVLEDLIALRQSSNSKKWYVVIGEMMCLQSRGVVNGGG